MSLLLRGGRRADGTQVDVRCDGERVTAVAPTLTPEPGDEVVALDGWLLLGAPAEPHAHLDKAFTADRVPNPSGDLLGAITAWHAYRKTLTLDDIVERAVAAAEVLLANGITAIRSHADVGTDIGTRHVEALVAAREQLAGRLDLEVVALVGCPLSGPDGAGHRAALRDAMAAGADVVGGCPHLDPDPEAALDIALSLAAELDRPIDLHTDETLNPGAVGLRRLAARVAEGFAPRATASHCVSLGMHDEATQRATAEEVAAAGVAVVALPQTNLFLQGREHPVATPRGLTAVRALLAAGATLAAGADNLQDPFNLVGRGDPFETAALMVMAGHLSPEEAWATVTDGSRAAMGLAPAGPCVGAAADLLAVDAPSVRAAVASAPVGRTVVHRGRIVAAQRLSRGM